MPDEIQNKVFRRGYLYFFRRQIQQSMNSV